MASAVRMLAAILLPFRRTFRRPEFKKHWWHRLCVLLFFSAIPFMFAGDSVLSYLAFAPASSSEPVILERLYLFDKNSKVDDPIPPLAVGKVMLMPDGTTVDFPFSVSDEAIKAEWTRAKLRGLLKAILWAGLLAILGTLILSYLLQYLYRTLLCVILGTRGSDFGERLERTAGMSVKEYLRTQEYLQSIPEITTQLELLITYLHGLAHASIAPGSMVITDEHHPYRGINFTHEVINHADAYMRGNIHTNGIENFWSTLKRSLGGTYIEPFHLFRYTDEQAFRFNNRRELDDLGRFELAARNVAGKRLTYATLTSGPGSAASL